MRLFFEVPLTRCDWAAGPLTASTRNRGRRAQEAPPAGQDRPLRVYSRCPSLPEAC